MDQLIGGTLWHPDYNYLDSLTRGNSAVVTGVGNDGDALPIGLTTLGQNISITSGSPVGTTEVDDLVTVEGVSAIVTSVGMDGSTQADKESTEGQTGEVSSQVNDGDSIAGSITVDGVVATVTSVSPLGKAVANVTESQVKDAVLHPE